MVYDIVEGTTGTLEFQLLENGVPIDLAGVTVTILMEDRAGTTVSSPGTITVTDSDTGTIQLVPTSTSIFVASSGPYYVRWKLTASSGEISYVPSVNRDVFNITGV